MMKIRELCSGLRVPEGPVALADGSILLTEVAGGCMTRVYPDGSKQVVADTGGGPNGAAIGPDGKCYICNNGGIEFSVEDGVMKPIPNAPETAPGYIQRLDIDTGKIETIYSRSATTELRAPNDLVFDAHGGFWFTDFGKIRERTRDRGAVFYAKPDGSLIEEVIAPLDSPNGIGLSPDGKSLYVSETFTGHVLRFDVAAPGKIKSSGQLFGGPGNVLARAPARTCLDSLAVDGEGYVCVATPVTGGLLIVAPDGSSVEHIPLPDVITTNICFGGKDLRTAFMTFAYTGKLVAFDWPRSGLKLNYQ